MKRLACNRCGHVLASPRGPDRVRLVKLPIIALRVARDGTQSLETVCPRCKADVSLRLPVPPEVFRSGRVEANPPAAAIDTSRLSGIVSPKAIPA